MDSCIKEEWQIVGQWHLPLKFTFPEMGGVRMRLLRGGMGTSGHISIPFSCVCL